MKKLIFFVELLLIVTSISSFSCAGQKSVPALPNQTPVKFFVNYKNTVEQLSTTGGYFFYKNEISNILFKKEKSIGKDSLTGILVSLPGFITSKNVLDSMQSHGLRPATIKELQSFGIETHLIEGFGVVALGSEVVFDGFKSVPLILDPKRGLALGLYPSEGKWNGNYYYFLGITKKVLKK
ncbi:MAG: hypothetical protein WAV23_03485 [Minisyncoccia bacterium]